MPVASEPNRRFVPASTGSAAPVACQFSIYDSIRDVDVDEWNRVRNPRHDPFMDPGFIEAVENSMGTVCRFRHVVVRDKSGTPIAAACLSRTRSMEPRWRKAGRKKS
jgi:predicted N-acyltransferase